MLNAENCNMYAPFNAFLCGEEDSGQTAELRKDIKNPTEADLLITYCHDHCVSALFTYIKH